MALKTFGRLHTVILTLLVAGSAALGWSSPAAADCTRAEAAEADRWLWLNARDRSLSVTQNLPWGAPRPLGPVTRERQLTHWDYVIGYDADLRVPLWTAERVIGTKLGKATRSDCFRKDVRLNGEDASTPSDYDEAIFDQGHVTPSANLTTSKLSVHNSFIMSNMTPQFCQFNRGVWQILEELTRRWALARGTIHVLSGSIFDRDNDGRRDPDDAAVLMTSRNLNKRVAIPSAFYKVIAYQHPSGTVETLTLLLPHDQTDLDRQAAVTYLGQHVSTLAAVEQLTGTDLLPNLQGEVAEATALWPFAGQPPRSLAHGEQCRRTAGAVIR